jgi:hypothetical protein
MEYITATFPTWKSYTDALTEMLNTEFYAESFPEYGKLIAVYNNADMSIVTVLLNAGYNAQDGFNLFIDACFNGSRYIDDFSDRDLNEIVDVFIANGAKVTPKMVHDSFDAFCTPETHFEDVCNDILSRSFVLDAIGKHITIPVPDQDSWKNIKATYWEEIPSDTEYSMKCMMVQKYCSKFLQSL